MCSSCLVFVVCFVFCSAALYPDNPCPGIFTYGTGQDNSVIGKISLPFDGKTQKLRLTVNASLIGVYNQAKLGIQLLTPKDEILGARTLNYEVYFPFPNNIPKITQITFNGDVLCSSTPYALVLPGSGVTNIWASSEYTINTFTYPITSSFGSNKPSNLDENPFLNNVVPSTTSPPQTVDSKFQVEEVCGLDNGVQNLIVNGETTSENQYPWVVAMMVVSNKSGYQYKCTANLISDRHVITAAQCVQFFRTQVVKTEDILLIIGKSDLSHWATSDAVKRTAKKVTVHPDYRQYTAHGDLCIIELAEPVPFKTNVRPVCLWKGDTNIQSYVNDKGRVCGYGQGNPDDTVATYRAISMPIVSPIECLRSNSAYRNLTSENTFCAGDKNGAGPCIGDSGAGFFLKNSNNKWTLRGLVSIALKQSNSCKLDEYVVFCDVAKYTQWIKSVISD